MSFLYLEAVSLPLFSFELASWCCQLLYIIGEIISVYGLKCTKQCVEVRCEHSEPKGRGSRQDAQPRVRMRVREIDQVR